MSVAIARDVTEAAPCNFAVLYSQQHKQELSLNIQSGGHLHISDILFILKGNWIP